MAAVQVFELDSEPRRPRSVPVIELDSEPRSPRSLAQGYEPPPKPEIALGAEPADVKEKPVKM